MTPLEKGITLQFSELSSEARMSLKAMTVKATRSRVAQNKADSHVYHMKTPGARQEGGSGPHSPPTADAQCMQIHLEKHHNDENSVQSF